MTENEALYILNNYKFDMRQNGAFDMITTISVVTNAIKELQRYREIGTVEECREAVEKQKPKKIHPLNRDSLLYKDGWRYKCPICGCAVGENVYHPDVTKDYEYCSMCGQKIEE